MVPVHDIGVPFAVLWAFFAVPGLHQGNFQLHVDFASDWTSAEEFTPSAYSCGQYGGDAQGPGGCQSEEKV